MREGVFPYVFHAVEIKLAGGVAPHVGKAV